jgi:hypothetical protein
VERGAVLSQGYVYIWREREREIPHIKDVGHVGEGVGELSRVWAVGVHIHKIPKKITGLDFGLRLGGLRFNGTVHVIWRPGNTTKLTLEWPTDAGLVLSSSQMKH